MMSMCELKVHNLPVVDADGSFIGLFSLRRIAHELLPVAARVESYNQLLNFDLAFVTNESDDYLDRLQKVCEQPVSTLLEKKKKLRFCSPDTPIPRLLQLLTENPASLPVVVLDGDQRKLVGMVSAWDVLTKIAQTVNSTRNPVASKDRPDASRE